MAIVRLTIRERIGWFSRIHTTYTDIPIPDGYMLGGIRYMDGNSGELRLFITAILLPGAVPLPGEAEAKSIYSGVVPHADCKNGWKVVQWNRITDLEVNVD
jgi:hypothetical protein